MSRQVKNAKDIVTGDLVYFVSHAKATYLGDGSTVEDTVNVMKRDIKNITLSTEATTMVSVTYEELKNLRDNGELVPGQQYRITDYVTTTTQENTRSAGHPFNLIVTADDEKTLNEVARACLTDINMEKYDSAYSPNWDEYLEYCGTYEYNGKVYYRYRSHHLHVLIDFNETIKNIIPTEDYPYYIAPSYVVEHVDREPDDIDWNSYKNSTKTIAFKYVPRINSSNLAAWKIWYCLDNDTERFAWADVENGKGIIYRMIDEFGNDCPYDFKNIMMKHPNDSDDTNYYYTFGTGCYNNIILPYESNHKLLINKNIFGTGCRNNSFGTGCRNNSFGTVCINNSFGNNCHNNNLGNNCSWNSFDNACHNNSLDSTCYNNSFGNNNWNNSFGIDCNYNSLGNGCIQNIFKSECRSNSLGNACNGNILGNGCDINSFGNYFDHNSLGDYCDYNSFGNYCCNNSFGNYFRNNSFGNYCRSNSFRSSVSATASLKDYCEYNHFDDGCCHNVVWTLNTTSSSNKLQNINVNRGVNGKVININNINSEQEINVNQVDTIVSIGEVLSIRYNALKTLRDNAQLIPGRQYRIIDYNTTTSQENTKSAEHQFDIIVTALDNWTLSEEAQATQNTSDGYFDGSNLSAWKIWYSLDNDTERFAWAGDEGVQTVEVEAVNSSNCTISVGYSYDEEEGLNKFDNRVSFISQVWDDPVNDAYLEGSAIDELITHWGYETDPNGIEDCLTLYGLNLEFDEETGEITSEDGISGDRWYYRGIVTVDGTDYDYWEKAEWGGNTGDFGYMDKEYSEKLFFLTNRIVSGEPTIETITQETVIPLEPKGVIYYMKDEHGNEAPYDFKNIMFKYRVSSIDSNYAYTFSSVNNYTLIDSSVYPSCYNNKIDKYISNGLYKLPNNIFCNNDRIDTCYGNVLGLNCYNNEFGGSCCFNRFGDNCYDNRLQSGCAKNSFGNNCYSNRLSKNSTNNSFGVSCHNNLLGENAISNSFGNLCSSNEFGDYCESNSFGNQCYLNKFYSKTPMSTLSANYVFHCRVDDGCKINIIVADNYNTTKKLKNLHVRRGVSDINWISQPLTLLDANYEITVAKNSKGEIKVYCEADLIK